MSFRRTDRQSLHKPGDYVLVAGAAHIDVLADYASADHAKTDKIGSVRYSTGGTGYNIAINLAQSAVPVEFLSVLKKNSFSNTWITERLTSSGVGTKYLQLVNQIPESGFVGMREDGQLKAAVTSTAVGEYTFQGELIEKAVGNARLVTMDCNLAVDQMSLLIDCAIRYNRPVIVAAVSDSKVIRLTQLEDHLTVDIVVLNELELRAAFDDEPGDHIAEACRLLRAKYVVVTAGERGYRIISDGGWYRHYRAPQIDKVVSQSGAGDALLSGIVAYWYKNQRIDFDDAASKIATSVRRVLNQPGSTVGSLATDIDFALLARIAIRNEPLWKRLLSPEMGVAFSIVVALLTVAILVLTYKLLPDSHHPPESAPAITAPSPGAHNP